jgi:site-specific DNA recombinase
MIAAIYARKSTDQTGVSEDQKSVTRQIAVAREYAARKGWAVVDDYVFADDGISGAEFSRRPGLMRLLNALKPAPPFQVLVMTDLDRLGRDSAETPYTVKQINSAGVQVWSISQNQAVRLDRAVDALLVQVQSFAASIEREKARQRTYDAMRRKAKAGHVTGGKTFGYDNLTLDVRGPDCKRSHVEPRVNGAEAATVRRIFELCAEGHGQKAIAIMLNDERAPCPRPQRGRPAGWAPSSVRAVLHREKYRGLLVWGKTQKRDAYGQVKQRPRTDREQIERSDEALRIVSDELWEAAHRRMDADRARYHGGFSGRAPEGKNLLSGMAKCGKCGGGMQAQTRSDGKERVAFYVCAASYERGLSVCANRVAVRVDTADRAVLDMIERDVLNADVLRQAAEDVRLRLNAKRQTAAGSDAEIARLQTELQRLIRIVVHTDEPSPSLAGEIKDREKQIERLKQQARNARTRAEGDPGKIRRTMSAKADEWRRALNEDREAARRVIGAIIDGRLTFTPRCSEDGEGYLVTGTASIDDLLPVNTLAGLASPTGFEPYPQRTDRILVQAA